MSAYSSVLGVAVVLLHLWATDSFPTSQTCPVPCLCQPGPLLDCSSLGLTRIPVNIPATAIFLNISHNALHSLAPLSSGHVRLEGLRHLWVGSNSLESLSLVLKNNWSGTRTRPSGEQQCMSWAPDLQLLSAERNHLKHLPRGLHCMNSLQILQMSYNQISEIGPADLTNSLLKELHLQHNQITNIHSLAFINLKQLQVLDLSYNLLATIPVPAYQSLWSLNALVNVSFNRWTCDCNLQTLRRWIGLNTEAGDASWQVVCNSPPHHAGKDLLHLKDSDLTCPTHEYSTSGQYHNMIVDEGMQILISCRNDSQDFMQVHWWTPQGQIKDNQPELLIKDITEQHEGLYICVSGHQGEHISVFDLHVYMKGSGPRPRREALTLLDEPAGQATSKLQRNNNLKQQRTKTQSDIVLAVCLSVIITFIVAFILGVFLRPMLDKLWRRIRSKRHSTPSPTTSRASSLGPQPYVNEGYSDADDQVRDVRVGTRVTFGGVTEVGDQSSNVPYYVTVENVHSDGSSESNTEVETAYKNKQIKKSSEWRQQALEVDNHRGRASDNSMSSALEGKGNIFITNNKTIAPSSNKVMEFEPIPDEDNIIQPKRSSLSSSSSSHSRQTLDRNFSSEVRESTEQSVDPPNVTVSVNEITTKGKNPGFPTEPFTEFTEQNVDDLDTELWNESGESFSFNEESERSSLQDHSGSALGHLINNDDTWKLGNIESPSYKLNCKSHVIDVDKQFGTEVSVDDVKLHKLPDTLSSSSSSESGDSKGPNSYTVNPEIEEESEILHGSYRKIDSDRFQTPEDVTFNEKSQPGANILIRQETITLDPSDIHLTLTCEESVDEGMLIDDLQRNTEDVFGSCIDVCLDTVPKVKRYVQFTQSKPHSSTLPSLSPSSTKSNVTSEIEVKSEAKIDTSLGEASCLTQIKVSPETIRKVKRYINFKQSEPHSPTLPPSPSLTKDLMVEAKRSSTSSEDTEGEKVYGFPKLKRYIEFSRTDPYSATDHLNKQSISSKVEAPPESRSSSSSSEDDIKPTSKEDNFFETIGVSLGAVPKVERYIKFNQPESYSPTLSSSPILTKKLEAVVETSSSTFIKLNVKSDPKEDNYFGQTGVCLDTVPKVKRYVQFTQSKPDSSTIPSLSPSSTKSNVTSEIEVKSEAKNDTSLGEASYFTQTNVSPEIIPKVKRYIHFKQSEPHSPTLPPSPSLTKDSMVEAKRSSTSSEEEAKLTSEGDKYFRNIGVSSNEVPKVKRYITFKQIEPSSPTLSVSSPSIKIEATTSSASSTKKDISGKIPLTEYKKRLHSSNFTPEGLPLYHVHPVYRANQSRVNRNFDIDRSSSPSSSEDEDQFIVYPRKLEIKTESENIKGSITSDKNTDKVLNIDFDNSSSSTDVFEKKHNKGLTRLKVLSTRLFNRRENETDEKNVQSQVQTGSTTIPDLFYKSHSKLTEDTVQQTTNEDSFFGHIGLSFDQLKRPKKSILFTISDSQSPNQLLYVPSNNRANVHEEKAEFESRRSSLSSSSDEGSISAKHEGNIISGQSSSFNQLPKVKRYLQFSHFDPHSQAQLTSSPPTTGVVTSSLIATSESRKSSSSSADDVKEATEGEKVYGFPKLKRYIEFSRTDPYSATDHLNKQSISSKVEAPPESRSSSSSSEDDIKPISKEDNFFETIGVSLGAVPKVERYIKFNQPKSYSPTLSSSPILTKKLEAVVETSSSTFIKLNVKSDPKEDNYFGQTGVYLDTVPKVKRYVKFTQSKPDFSTPPSLSPSLTKTNVSPEIEVKLEAKVDTFPGEASYLTQTNVFPEIIPKVKRYIHFKQSEPHSPSLPPSPSSINKDVRVERSSTSSEDEAKLTTEEDNLFRNTGLFSDGISKVKRYITFKQFEPTSPTLSVSSPSTKTEATTGAGIKSMQSSSLSEDDFSPASKEHEFFGEICFSLARLPQVKRYIQFKQPVSHLPVVSPTISLNTLHVTPDNKKLGLRKLSTSSEESIILTAQEDNFFGQTGAPLDGIPKVKRSILFTQPESQSSTQSTTAQSVSISEVVNETRRSSTSSEEDIIQSTNDDNMNGETVESLVKIPKVKRYIKFTQSEPSLGLSPIPVKSMEGSIPVKSLAMEDNVKLNRLSQTSWSSSSSKSTDGSVEQTGLQPQLRKSSYLSSDNRDFFGHVIMDEPPPQNEPPAIPQTPPTALEQEDARQYLRDNSQVRQRQERRRLLQQRRKAMDVFSITSLSSSPQEGNKQNSSSLVDYGGSYSNVSVVNTVTSRRTEAAEVPALQGLKTKNISALRSKSQVDSANTKYKEFLI